MKTFSPFPSLAAVAALVLAFASPAATAADNLIVNPGFETGTFSGWNPIETPSFTEVLSAARHSGSFGARFGTIGEPAILSQTITTTPGQSYNLGYWLQNIGGTPNAFQVTWGDSVVASLTDSDAFDYTAFNLSNLVATSASTTLSFSFRHDPSFWYFDDVSLVAAGNNEIPGGRVPDAGSSAFLMVLGLAALVGVRRRLR